MTNSDLVRLARDGDRDAFDLLMTAAIDHLYRIARLILRDFDSAEDAVQEALVHCWRDLPGLRDPDRFDAWLNRLLIHSVTDEARRRRRAGASLTILRIEPSQPDGANALANRDELARVFGRLSIEHRTIVVLHHYLGLTVDEAACNDRDSGRDGQVAAALRDRGSARRARGGRAERLAGKVLA